jgi:uncharacterized membrane protein
MTSRYDELSFLQKRAWGGAFGMALFIGFLALISMIFLVIYSRLIGGKLAKRKKQLIPVAVFRPASRRSVTRSEWKRGRY